MNNFYYEAGIRIRELREKNRYTREKLSELAEISPKFLYEIETGQKGFSADTLYRVARSLTVSCEYIITGNTQNNYDSKIMNSLELFNSSQMSKLAEILQLIHEMRISS